MARAARSAEYADDCSSIQKISAESTKDLERYLEYAKSVDKNRAAIEAGTEKFVELPCTKCRVPLQLPPDLKRVT
jgi:hypothetical protein